MSIAFKTDGSIECYGVYASPNDTTGKVRFEGSNLYSSIKAGYFFITDNSLIEDMQGGVDHGATHGFNGLENRIPYFGNPPVSPAQTPPFPTGSSLSKVNCTELKLSSSPLIYDPYVGTNDFDGIFESPYLDFDTVSFSGISVSGDTPVYIKRPSIRGGENPNDRFYYANDTHTYMSDDHHMICDGCTYKLYDAAPRGHIATSYRITTITNNDTSGERELYITSNYKGVRVVFYNSSGTTSESYYSNSNRGEYFIYKLGVLFCGGGGGGAPGNNNGTQAPDWGGGGGGGAGAALCLLDLKNYDYWITLGVKGSPGSKGGDSYIVRVSKETHDEEEIVRCEGGYAGSQRNGGSGGGVNHITGEEFIASANGGTGGTGYLSSGSGTPPTAGGGASISGKFYGNTFSSSDDLVSESISGGTAGSSSNGGGGGGSSAVYLYNPRGQDSYYGQGGRGGLMPSSSGTRDGSSGTASAIHLYY